MPLNGQSYFSPLNGQFFNLGSMATCLDADPIKCWSEEAVPLDQGALAAWLNPFVSVVTV